MKNLLALFTLVAGILISANSAEASVKTTNVFKSMEITQNSPWDPRDKQPVNENSQDEVINTEIGSE